ncbi:IS21 family transposase [Streptomyces sp. 6N223]|uniref:IS21 family transposase n=1 Tax=Streptomyces sp. 6N223 TaxID=3457412 RepID=UPI003FD3BEB0
MKKSEEEIIEILVAYDATESVSAAAKITGCDPKTVRRYVAVRDEGRPVTGRARRARLADPYMAKIEEWVDRSQGHITAARVHERLVRLGFTGSRRTTRRMLGEARDEWRRGNRRPGRAWLPEPGLWMQFGWGEGPTVPGPDGAPRRTSLFCAWLPWSRFRVVIPCWDRTTPTLICCLDAALRAMGGVPTYALTRPRPRGGVELRHPVLVAAARHYGIQLRACVPAEAAAGGAGGAGGAVGRESVRIAAADLVPTDAGLPAAYPSFAELQEACRALGERAGAHGGAPGAGRLAVERDCLHALPPAPSTPVLGRAVTVRADHTIEYGSLRYPVLPGLAGREVWVRPVCGDLAVVAYLAAPAGHPAWPPGRAGLTEIARHRIRKGHAERT